MLIEKSSYESTQTKSVRDAGKMEYYNENMNVNKQTNSTTPEKKYVLIGNVWKLDIKNWKMIKEIRYVILKFELV